MHILGHGIYFYHVYREGSLAKASAAMRLSEAAVSEGLQVFEEYVGTLFLRQVGIGLVKTPLADELFGQVAPYIESMILAAQKAGARGRASLRVGGPDIIMNGYMNHAARVLRAKHPGVHVRMRNGSRDFTDRLMREGELDLAIVCVGRQSRELSWHTFLPLQPVLFVPAKSPYRSAEDLLRKRAERPLLIAPPESEDVCDCLRGLLRARKIDWSVEMNAASASAVPGMVADGGHVGLGLDGPPLQTPPGIRALPLPVPPLNVAACWRGRGTPFIHALVAILDEMAQAVRGK